LTTAGNLVFQGRGDGTFVVYAADTGKVLKAIDTGSAIMAAPDTYTVNGTQYVAVQAGYGGGGIAVPISPQSAAAKYMNDNRILVFKLDGTEVPKPPLRNDGPIPSPPASTATAAEIARGEVKFTEQCSQCHVFAPNVTPNLTRLSAASHTFFNDTVLHGIHEPMGMASFSDRLNQTDVSEIHAYLINEQRKAYGLQQSSASKK